MADVFGLSSQTAGRVKAVTRGDTTAERLRDRPPAQRVEFLLPTGVRVSGRYPAMIQVFDAAAGTWAAAGTAAVWLVEPNGGKLPTDRPSPDDGDLTAYRWPAVAAGDVSGVPVYLALVPPGVGYGVACADPGPGIDLSVTPAS